MARFTDKDILYGLKNGSKEVLFYLSGRFYQSSRRWMRSKGIRDADTPALFSEALLRMMREVQQKELPEHLDPADLLSNIIRNLTRERRSRNSASDILPDNQQAIVSGCFSILDDSSRDLLSARFADRMGFQQLAVRFGFGNAAIAEAEINKAMDRLERMVNTRLSF